MGRRRRTSTAPPEMRSPAGAVEGADRAGRDAAGQAAERQHSLRESTRQPDLQAAFAGRDASSEQDQRALPSPPEQFVTPRQLGQFTARCAYMGATAHRALLDAFAAWRFEFFLIDCRCENFALHVAGGAVVLIVDDHPTLTGPAAFDPAALETVMAEAASIAVIVEPDVAVYVGTALFAASGAVAVLIETTAEEAARWSDVARAIAPAALVRICAQRSPKSNVP